MRQSSRLVLCQLLNAAPRNFDMLCLGGKRPKIALLVAQTAVACYCGCDGGELHGEAEGAAVAVTAVIVV